jgi:hypothetical protein
MNDKDLSHAKDPDLRNAMDALKRAGELARKIAIQTDTDLVIAEEGHLVHIPSEELRSRELKAANTQ